MRRIEPCYKRFGENLRALRESRLTQEQLAKKIGHGRPSITNIEIGKQRVLLDDVGRLAKALGVDPKVLLEGIWTK
jgi:transcriptional regulator with XRE-family HTH domain